LTLEGPKLQFYAHTSLDKLDETIRRSAEGGWLKMLGIRAESWESLKQMIVENWDVVVEAAVRRLGEKVRGELEALRDRLNDDKVARKVVAPALLLIQAERLGVNEETLKYFGAVISGAIRRRRIRVHGDEENRAGQRQARCRLALGGRPSGARHQDESGKSWGCVSSSRVGRRCRQAGRPILSLWTSSA
jgi:hypothetical protein